MNVWDKQERIDFWKMIVMAAVASGRKTATEACQMADTALAELIIRQEQTAADNPEARL